MKFRNGVEPWCLAKCRGSKKLSCVTPSAGAPLLWLHSLLGPDAFPPFLPSEILWQTSPNTNMKYFMHMKTVQSNFSKIEDLLVGSWAGCKYLRIKDNLHPWDQPQRITASWNHLPWEKWQNFQGLMVSLEKIWSLGCTCLELICYQFQFIQRHLLWLLLYPCPFLPLKYWHCGSEDRFN